MKLKFRITAIASRAFMLAVPASTRADAVTDWNAIAVQTTVTAGRPGPTGVLDVVRWSRLPFTMRSKPS